MDSTSPKTRPRWITIKTAILQSQSRAAKLISGSQLSLYFGVGLYVSANSREGTWGTGAIDTVSEQLHRELPGLRGFSAQNIRNMRQFAEFWQPFLFHSPAASNLTIMELNNEIEYDRFALAKWSPTASEINRDEFLSISFSHHMEILHKTKKTYYAVRDYNKPMGVSTYKTMTDMLENMQQILPDIEELKKLIENDDSD